MRPSPRTRLALLLAASMFACAFGRADDTIPYRPLTEEDFKKDPPPKDSPERQLPPPEGGTAQASTASGIATSWKWEFVPDGKGGTTVKVTAADSPSDFDPNSSWFDKAGLTRAERAALLKHEQGHFDISEQYAREAAANAAKIKQEAQTGLNGDPADKKTFQDNDDANAMDRAELKTPHTPAEKKDFQDKIDKRLGENIDLLRKHSKTLRDINDKLKERQDDYDKKSKHGSDPGKQKAEEKVIGDDLLKTSSLAPTPAAHSPNGELSFDASSGRLTATGGLVTNVTTPGADPFVGATATLADYLLAGRTSYGDPVFAAVDGVGAFSVTGSNGDPLLTGTVPYLIDFRDRNRLFGFLDNPLLPGNSPFLTSLSNRLADPEPGQLGIALTTDADFAALAGDFTVSRTVPSSGTVGVTQVPAPPAAILAGVALVVFALRRRRG